MGIPVLNFLGIETISFYIGQGLIRILLGALLLSIAILVFLSWALVRYFKPKIGRTAYYLAAIPFTLIALALFAEFERGKPNEGPPKVVAANRLPGLIKRLPRNVDFSIAGLSFFDGGLYVGTNLGIVEVSGGATTRLYQFQSDDSVVSGPWLDKADHLLWAMDEHTGELLRFDGIKWTRMQKPVPAKGYYTRGDVLEGVGPIGNAEGFWLASGGTAWKWDAGALKWLQIAGNLPQPDDYHRVNDLLGVLPIGQTALLIVRHQPLSFILSAGEDFLSDELVSAVEPTATPVARDGKAFLADSWAATEEAGYICTKDGNLIRVTREHVAPLEAPGPCETVSSDDNSNLLVSIKSKGIFCYTDGKWMLLARSPYPGAAGEYWTHVSASSGQLAVAIDGKPVIDSQHSSGSDMHFTRNAPTSLWVFRDGNFVTVSF
jgi:hypothetical protein